MFNEILQYRKIITEDDKTKPLTMEEIHKAGLFNFNNSIIYIIYIYIYIIHVINIFLCFLVKF